MTSGVVSKLQIAPKIEARAVSVSRKNTKKCSTLKYMSILRRLATQIFGVRWDFETTSMQSVGLTQSSAWGI